MISINPITVLADEIHSMRDRGADIISLHQGELNLDTPDYIKDAAYDALKKGYTHYAPTSGYSELKEAIADKVSNKNKMDVDPETEIQITQGLAEGLFVAILALINPKDEVLIIEPFYPSFVACVKMAGGTPIYVINSEENAWRPSIEEIEAKIGPKTKAIIVNSPCNPTGEVFDKGFIKAVSDVAKRFDLFVISDEAYEYLTYDGVEHHSIGSFPDMMERTMSLYSFSKTYAMTGWRLGYIVGPKESVERANVIHQAVLEHVTSHIQIAAIAALTGTLDFTHNMLRKLDERRKLLTKGINEIEGISCRMPKGAFYVFPNIKSTGMNSLEFSTELLRKTLVAVTPGTAFGKCGEGYVRIAYSQSSEEDIERGLERMKEYLGTA